MFPLDTRNFHNFYVSLNVFISFLKLPKNSELKILQTSLNAFLCFVLATQRTQSTVTCLCAFLIYVYISLNIH